ncbi:MAG: hypothetical protein K2K96_09590 [Lachnospiraceae bacterium]|nr:hypothetical protein [Lachnospiraceae bacterium]
MTVESFIHGTVAANAGRGYFFALFLKAYSRETLMIAFPCIPTYIGVIGLSDIWEVTLD